MTVNITIHRNYDWKSWTIQVFAQYLTLPQPSQDKFFMGDLAAAAAMAVPIKTEQVYVHEATTLTDEVLLKSHTGAMSLLDRTIKERYGKYPPIMAEWDKVRFDFLQKIMMESLSSYNMDYKKAVGGYISPYDGIKFVESDLDKITFFYQNQLNNSYIDKFTTQKPADQLSYLSNLLPGVNEFVKYPCNCVGKRLFLTIAPQSGPFPEKASLKNVIIHLNDKHKWTRDKIADWLETLDVDLTFKNGDSNEQD